MKYLVPACTALLLTACASPDPVPVEIEPRTNPEPVVVEEPVLPEPVAVALIDRVFFPELQGIWNSECRPFDIDNQPIIASLQGFFQFKTGYSIVVVNGNQLFLSDESGGKDSESAAGHPANLDTDRVYARL